jgi:hypothetical protein
MVQVELPRGVPAVLGVDYFAHPYLDGLEILVDGRWLPVARAGRSWRVPSCQSEGCRLRYRYHLAQAAHEIDRFGFAAFRGGALLAPPSTWLLHPQRYSGTDQYRFSVDTRAGEEFVTGVFTTGAELHGAAAELLFEAPYSGFGRFRQERARVGTGVMNISVSLAERGLDLSPALLRDTLSSAAALVSEHFGRFPVPEVTIIVLPMAGSEMFGMQLGNGGATILLFVGRSMSPAAFAQDWVIRHELLHLGFPTLPRQHLWLAEGLATYQEPILRARARASDAEQLWRGFLTGMPQGLPAVGDGGLDGSSSWGRIYWGGALFCLLADVAIRAESDNRQSLDDAARAILAQGGDTSVRWTLERTLAIADRALERPQLGRLYAEHAAAEVRVDLPALWRRLGVRQVADRIVFDEQAEWAHVRRAISQPLGETRAVSPLQSGQVGLAAPGVPKSPL